MNKTKFYKILSKAKNDEISLVLVINKIMPLINKYSINENNEIDEDLRSYLLEQIIKIIKDEGFAEKMAKNKF